MNTIVAIILAAIVVSLVRNHAFKGSNMDSFVIDIVIALILVGLFKGC